MQQSLFGGAIASEPPAAPLQELLATPLREAVMTVLDLETTGLAAKKNSITEVTAIQYRNGEEIGKYSTLIKPSEPIPPEVEDLTGITNDMVKNAPALVMALSDLSAFVGPTPIIVGHNVGFDLGFLREKHTQSGLAGFVDRYDYTRAFCTKVLAQKLLPGLPSYEGIVVATSVGVHNPNPHRAEADVRMSAGILFALFDKLEAQGVKTVGDLLTFQGPLS